MLGDMCVYSVVVIAAATLWKCLAAGTREKRLYRSERAAHMAADRAEESARDALHLDAIFRAKQKTAVRRLRDEYLRSVQHGHSFDKKRVCRCGVREDEFHWLGRKIGEVSRGVCPLAEDVKRQLKIRGLEESE